MYARMVQLTVKSGQGKDLTRAMQERTLPILKQQPGFVDALALNSDTEAKQFVAITIWKSKEDADNYVSGAAQQILEAIKPLLEGEPTFRTFNVEAPVRTVGSTTKPARPPPQRTRAPLRTASSIQLAVRMASLSRMSGPTSVDSSSGSPALSFFTPSTRRSVNFP